MIKIHDIQLFITTHNRANYLQASIESILNQTAGVTHLTILDNESTDNTQAVVESYAHRGVRYVKTTGFLGNFHTVKKLTTLPYVMLFHDDDLLHPQYLEFALNELNTHPNLVLLTTRYVEFTDSTIPTFEASADPDVFFFQTQKEFARFLYFKECVAYASAIYRSDVFLATPLDYERYSKFNDWPFMVSIAGQGASVIFKDPQLFRVRRHPNQDTMTTSNTLTLEQVVNWDVCFYEALQISPQNQALYLVFMLKMLHFSTGKYEHFVDASIKQPARYPQDLLQAILQSSMEIDIALLIQALTSVQGKALFSVRCQELLDGGKLYRLFSGNKPKWTLWDTRKLPQWFQK